MTVFTIDEIIEAVEAQIMGEPVDFEIEKIEAAVELLKERKTGKWAICRDLRDPHCEHLYYCTCCEWNNDHSKTAFKYCPNCGAKMEVDDAGDNGDIPT